MEQQFKLKYYGNLSLFEQNAMTAEDRNWFIRRLDKELKEKAEREKGQMGSVPKPSAPTPYIPKPYIPKP